MKLSEDQLKELESFAYRTLSIDDIAVILDVSEKELKRAIDTDQSPERRAYKAGQLRLQAELRKSEIDLAIRGHADAQRRVEKYITEQKQREE
jgi:hypothetical protein